VTFLAVSSIFAGFTALALGMRLRGLRTGTSGQGGRTATATGS
jgi:hypothetical protein